MADKMAHTDDSVQVCDMSARPTPVLTFTAIKSILCFVVITIIGAGAVFRDTVYCVVPE